MDPCRQEGNIAGLKAILGEVREESKSTRQALEKNNELLSRIAEQAAEIRHLREDTNRNERDIDALFSRMRAVEAAPGGEAKREMSSLKLSAIVVVGSAIVNVLFRLLPGGAP